MASLSARARLRPPQASARLRQYAAPAALAGFTYPVVSPVVPTQAAELKHGNAVVGLLYGFSFVFDVLCAPLGAWLMDR